VQQLFEPLKYQFSKHTPTYGNKTNSYSISSGSTFIQEAIGNQERH
jgi:hypothetical protein